MAAHAKQRLDKPRTLELCICFGKIGLLSFGGPAGQIALMHKMIVDERKWLTETHYLNALSFCMVLPGPEAMQLATYAGWRLRGVIGGLIAGLLFIAPGALVIMVLAVFYAFYGAVEITQAIFLGVKAAVLALVLGALLKLTKTALVKTSCWVVAGVAFFCLFLLNLPFPFVLFLAGLYGAGKSERSNDDVQILFAPGHLVKTATISFLWAFIWLLPLILLSLFQPNSLLSELGLFFSKLATVTFGGAYAVLAYMAQDVVQQFGWLEPVEMMDGLGLAETTPGPLILVTQFVGFLAGYKEGGLAMALTAACLTLWVTFVPCFLWIFAFAPYVEWISHQPRLKSALRAITAAAVGVIFNLSLWFALHLFFDHLERQSMGPFQIWQPHFSSANVDALALTLVSAAMMLILKWPITRIFGIMIVASLSLSLTEQRL